MTTIDRAAAWRASLPYTRAVLAVIAALAMGGCSTGLNILSGDGGDPGTSPLAAQTAQPAVAQKARIAVAPVFGPPDALSKTLQARIETMLEQGKVTVAKSATDPSEYTLRGYIVAAREKSNTKISYIWDVTDPAGKRVNRISGEEIAPSTAKAGDTWGSMSAEVVDKIATKTSSSVSAWLATQSQSAVPVANAAPAAAATAGAASSTSLQAAASPGLSATPAPAASPSDAAASTTASPSASATGSIGRPGQILATVPSVTGAPGDGGIALTSAIQRELGRSGVSLVGASAGAYKVEGKVAVGEAKDGKQPVSIDWHVRDPSGKKLGTVSQKNEVPQGSLDGAWGKTADAAAAAAAQGILKLLPSQTASRTN